MLSEPRTISILAELIHIPTKQPFERLRDVYNAISGSCGYDNCIRLPVGARLERGQGQSENEEVSTMTFLTDRVQMVEDNLAMSVEGVGKKLAAVLEKAMPTLGIPFFLAQQFTVRAIAAPNSFKTASEFIGRSLFRIGEEDVAVLERPTNIFGLRLIFPPTKNLAHNFNVRIEAYTRDPKSVYIENVGVFKAPIEFARLEVLQKNLELTSEFISSNVCRFLSQYDRRESMD
jgi:hypothetical protein